MFDIMDKNGGMWMSWRDKLGNVVKQAGNYFENTNLKEKMVEIKDKTMDKMKGIDNPEHYTAPNGFTLFKIPVAISTAEITRTLEKIEPFSLKEQDKIVDAYVRLLSLLTDTEKIQDAIIATMKKTYLIVWTNKDRLFVVHKEHYKIFTREMMHTFKIEDTGTFGMHFLLNEYRFTGSEKSKIYCFIRNYCHENTKEYLFTPYLSISKNLNYYEQFKYGKLSKENEAIEENRQLSILFEPYEFPLVSVFANHLGIQYILVLTTEERFFLINQKEYTILNMSDVKQMKLMNKGVFSSEFYMDNYYFTGCGPEHNVLRLIQYFQNKEEYENVKKVYLEENQALVQFPFKNAIFFQTPSGEGIVFSNDGKHFLVCYGSNKMEMYSKSDFDHYDLILDIGVVKDDIWMKEQTELAEKKVISKEDAISHYDQTRICLFLKNHEKPSLEIPLMLLKRVIYNDLEQITKAGSTITKDLLDRLDQLYQS